MLWEKHNDKNRMFTSRLRFLNTNFQLTGSFYRRMGAETYQRDGDAKTGNFWQWIKWLGSLLYRLYEASRRLFRVSGRGSPTPKMRRLISIVRPWSCMGPSGSDRLDNGKINNGNFESGFWLFYWSPRGSGRSGGDGGGGLIGGWQLRRVFAGDVFAIPSILKAGRHYKYSLGDKHELGNKPRTVWSRKSLQRWPRLAEMEKKEMVKGNL